MCFGEFLPCSHILGVNKGNVRAGSAFCRERSGLRVPGRNQTRHVEHRGGSDFDAAEVVDQQASHSAWALRGGEGRGGPTAESTPALHESRLPLVVHLVSYFFDFFYEGFCFDEGIILLNWQNSYWIPTNMGPHIFL